MTIYDSPIKVGDKVECVENFIEGYDPLYGNYRGAGFELGLVFVVSEVRISVAENNPQGQFIYFGGDNGNGVYSNFVKKINNRNFKLERKK